MPRMCAFGQHPLNQPVHVDQKYHSFIRKTLPDFRMDELVCESCRSIMEQVYEEKKKKARVLHDMRKTGISTVSSTLSDSIDKMVSQTPLHKKSRSESQNGLTENTNIINLSELDKFVTSVSSGSTQSRVNFELGTISGTNSQQSLNSVHERSQTAARKETETGTLRINTPPALTRISHPPSTVIQAKSPSFRVLRRVTTANESVMSPTIYDENSDTRHIRRSQEPTTSAAAAKASKGVTPKTRSIRDFFKPGQGGNNRTGDVRVVIENITATNSLANRTQNVSATSQQSGGVQNGHSTMDSEDDDPAMSLNYYNPDVRLPQYQPIPKRRPFKHPNDQVMDIYAQGLTGG